MSYIEIPSADIAVGKPTKKSLWQKIRDNFIDHETRIANLAASANKITVFDYHLDPKDLHIGEIVSSDMTTAEYQTVHGTGWVLCDGGSCTNSVYAAVTGHTVVPDYQTYFQRGAGTGVTLGTSYNADIKVSDITVSNPAVNTGNNNVDHTHNVPSRSTGSGNTLASTASSGGTLSGTQSEGISANHTHSVTSNVSLSAGGGINGTETVPKNVGTNFFIKINLSAQDGVMVIKARENMTLNAIQGFIIDNNGDPTSGNFEFDILKGTRRSALSTIFTTKPILAFANGAFAYFDAAVSGVTGNVLLNADNGGTGGNSILLTGDGAKTLTTLVSDWNTANPSNTVTLGSANGSDIPDNLEAMQLANGGDATDGSSTDNGAQSGSSYTISQGDWLQLDITAVMVGQSGLYIQVWAEPA